MIRRRTPWTIGFVAAAALFALGGAWDRSRGPAAPAAAAAATDTVSLVANQCTNVALTWPQGTSINTIAAAVSPAGALESIWKQTVRDDRLVFIAWSPLAGAPNDYTNTALPLEAAFVCMRAAGSLERPNR
jgi:hypothetical protein